MIITIISLSSMNRKQHGKNVVWSRTPPSQSSGKAAKIVFFFARYRWGWARESKRLKKTLGNRNPWGDRRQSSFSHSVFSWFEGILATPCNCDNAFQETRWFFFFPFFSSPPSSFLAISLQKRNSELGREKECKLDPRVDSSIVRYDSPKNTSAEAKIMTHHLERNMIENEEELLQQQKNPVRRLKHRSATCLSQETFKKFPHHALFSLRKRKKKATRCHIYIIDYSHFYFSLLI